jgi:SulP family sulfate permease
VTLGASGRFSLRDVVAGTSVGLVLIPQSMAYAELAGLPPHVGLYAGALPPIAAAFFASSPYLQTGPVALTALLTLGALLPLATPGSAEFTALAVLLALVVGVVRVLVGLLRGGSIAYFMSQPVLLGFTAGAAILILSSQLPGAVGATGVPAGGVLQRAAWVVTHPASWERASVLMTLATVAVIQAGRRIHPLVPGVLIATLGGLAWSAATGYGGPTLGEVPRGFPTPSLDLPWTTLPALIVPGAIIALVGFAEAASIARTFAANDRHPWDPDREFIGQGVANLASALSGGFPVGGSFSRSSINRLAGARSRWSGGFTGVVVLAFLPVAWILAPLPRAILSAIVLAAVVTLLRPRTLIGLWRISRPQAAAGTATFALTLLLSPRVDQAILVGVLLALGIHVWREMKPRLEMWTEGQTLHVRPEGVLWFGSAPELEKALLNVLGEDDRPRRLEIHLRALGRIDYTGAIILKQLIGDAKVAGVAVELVEVPAHAHRILRKVLDWRPDDAA